MSLFCKGKVLQKLCNLCGAVTPAGHDTGRWTFLKNSPRFWVMLIIGSDHGRLDYCPKCWNPHPLGNGLPMARELPSS